MPGVVRSSAGTRESISRVEEAAASAANRFGAGPVRAALIITWTQFSVHNFAAAFPRQVRGPCPLNVVRGGKTPEINLRRAEDLR